MVWFHFMSVEIHVIGHLNPDTSEHGILQRSGTGLSPRIIGDIRHYKSVEGMLNNY